jgi:lipopolysaccharide export system permease protein
MQKRSKEDDLKSNFRMFNMRQLNEAIDSLRKFNADAYLRVRRDVLGSFPYSTYVDSNWKSTAKADTVKSFDQVVPDTIKKAIRERVLSKLTNIQMSNEIAITDVKAQQKILRQHQIEWHRKLSLSLACLVLFLIGAPLGSIIRKGGLGSPLVFAIVFFMVFYFTSNTGEKAAKEGTMNPVVGMWLSTMFLTPIGLFLTYKAMRDSHLFNKEYYYRFWKKLRNRRKA